MDTEGRRRFFIFGSAILDVVSPVFRCRIDNERKTHGNGPLHAFMDRQPVKHAIFHLRHRYARCCTDPSKCINKPSQPLTSYQWDRLYVENPGQGGHHCHCNYTAKPIQLDDLDVTLAGLILVNCCNLSPADEQAVCILRQYRNDYFAHNTDGTLSQTDFDRHWPFLTAYILQLDNSKQAELDMIQRRPLDESLFNKYASELLDIHERIDEVKTSIDGQNNTILSGLTTVTGELNVMTSANNKLLNKLIKPVESNNLLAEESSTVAKENNELLKGVHCLLKGVNESMEVLLNYAAKGIGCHCSHLDKEILYTREEGLDKSIPYELGQPIFYLYRHAVTSQQWLKGITDGVIMDDERMVICHCKPDIKRLLIFNADMSDVDSIQLKYAPCRITAISNSEVAVTLVNKNCIEIYNIDNKQMMKSMAIKRMARFGITTMNKKLVVGGKFCLYIMDFRTGEKLQTLYTGDINPRFIHASGDRIFYCGTKCTDKNLYCYHGGDIFTFKLPFPPKRMISLRDESLYVMYKDGSVHHVSSDGKYYKPVPTEGLKSLNACRVISYNRKQRKLFTCSYNGWHDVCVFKEK